MLANIIRNAKKTVGGGGGGIVTGGDPYYSAVSLLLPMDGTNGSTTFTDSSLNAIAVTAVGNTQISTTQSKYGGASGYFDGSGDYLDMSGTGVATAFGLGDFTIEFWFYPLSVSVQQNLVDKIGSASNAIYMSSAGVLKYYASADRITGATLSANTWYHIALVRYSGVTKLYVNGVQSGASYTDTNNYALNTGSPRIGAAFNNTVSVNGYIDDFRISRFARYTSTFTPPTAALPTTASSTVADPYYGYTSLLLHMDGTSGSTNFVDSGPNALAVTAVGNAQISTSQSKYGGASGYFDGNGDYLTTPNSTLTDFGTGDFTIEAWSYGLGTIAGKWGSQVAWVLIANSTNITLGVGNSGTYSASLVFSSTISGTTWNHIAVTRSGTTVRCFLNGTQIGSSITNSANLAATATLDIGVTKSNLSSYMNGYIDDLRITKYARYTSAFAPPAQAFPNIYNPYASLPVSGAALWLAGDDSSTLYTDAGTSAVTKSGDLVYQWTDKSGNSRNAIQATSGNRPTWVAPANARNNLGALGFNASQWIDLADSTSLAFGTSDFTVECWIKPTSFSGNSFLLGAGTNSFCIYFASTGALNIGHYAVAGLGASSVISTSTWTHVAISRSGTSLRVFLNGTLTNTFTNSSNFQGSQVTRVGWDPAPSNGNMKYNGQIQNLVVYKGQALYTANFTPWMS